MFKPHYGTCTECNNEALIVVKKGYCQRCNYNIKQEKKKKKPSYKPAKKKVRKTTGEAKMFKEIWEDRIHQCVNCKCSLGNEARTFNFAHIIPKGREPKLRLEKSNIMLLCFDCHYAYDHGTKEQFNNRKRL